MWTLQERQQPPSSESPCTTSLPLHVCLILFSGFSCFLKVSELARALDMAMISPLPPPSPASSQDINSKFLGENFDSSVHLCRYQFGQCSREPPK